MSLCMLQPRRPIFPAYIASMIVSWVLAETAAITVARSKAELWGTIYRLTSKYGAAAKT